MRLIPYPQLKPEKGIHYTREHLRRLELAGEFPKRIRLADNPNAAVAWDEGEIDAWIERRRALRDGEAA